MSQGLGLGSAGFVDRHGLYSDEQAQAAAEVAARIEELGLRTMRLILVDQHGIARSKHLSGEGAIAAMRSGADFSGAIFSLDTGNRVFPPVFVEGGGFGIDEFTGFPDVVIVPDPGTFRVLPWADRTGWMICDAYFGNGRPLPLDGRAQLRAQLGRLRELGYAYLAGLEVELYITRFARSGIGLDETGSPGPAPEVEVFQRGYQFLSDARLDGIGDTLEAIRDGLWDVGLPPRSIEDEWGPGQIEFTYGPMEGLAAADALILFRSAVKAICRRRGLLASFMCWPALPNFFPSGWHLHQSLVDAETGANAFASESDLLSRGRAAVRRRPARLGAGDGGVRRSDRQRLRPVPPLFVRARPHRLGGREPGRAHPRPGRAGRSRHARREPPRPSPPRTPISGSPRTSLPASTASHAKRSRRRSSPAIPTPPRRRCCRSRSARPSTHSRRARSSGPRSGTRSSTTWR